MKNKTKHKKRGSVGDLGGKRRRREWQSVSWSAHFDVFAEQVGVETQPVPGDVESPLQQDVPQQRTGIHCRRRDRVEVKGGGDTSRCWFLRGWCRSAARGGAPCWSPFIRISSLGTVWKSLWYWELYLLTVCGGAENCCCCCFDHVTSCQRSDSALNRCHCRNYYKNHC